jgi:hypothetical protein
MPEPSSAIHVTELPLALEEVTHDPFVDDLPREIHDRQVARVRASVLLLPESPAE